MNIKRNQNFIIAILLLGCSLESIESFAQKHPNELTPYPYRAMHWGIEEKKPQGAVVHMLKDFNGFMWIGMGGGLCKFDGTIFNKYSHEINKNDSITSEDIRGLIEDSLHNIWIGTENGLSLYNINADTFRTVAVAPKHSPRSIVPFWATKDEVFCWDYPGSQWSAFNIHSLLKRPLAKILPGDMENDWFADRFSIFDAGSNSLWIEKDSGRLSGGGLLQIDLSTGEKKSYKWDCYRNIPNHNHAFQCMKYDRRRNAIWINSNDGLVEFTLGDKIFHHITATDSLVRKKNYHPWTGIDIDTLGRVWMCAVPKGIVIYDPANQSLQVAYSEDTVLQRKVSVFNLTIYCDRDGMVWSGSINEFFQLIPFSPPVHQYVAEPGNSNSLSNNFSVFTVSAEQGKVWIGSGDGINIFDPKSELFQVLRKNDLPGLIGEIHEMQPLCVDTALHRACIIAGDSYQTGLRFYLLDLNPKKCSPFIFKDSIDQILDIKGGFPRPFKNGFVQTVGSGNRTIVLFGTSDSPVAKQILSFPSGRIDGFSISSDEDHLLFFKLVDSNLNVSYTLDHGKWKRINTPLDTIPWSNIIFNKTDQTFWVNAKSSLLHMSRDFHPIRTYTQKDGLPDDDRDRVIPDNYGNIWGNTDHSIYHLDIKKGGISVLSERDGFLPHGFYPGLLSCKSSTGDIYLPSGGSGKGFTRISPDKYIVPSSIVYIKSLVVNQQTYYFSPGTKREPEIFVGYFENKFSVEPGSIDFNSIGNNQFRYKLGASAAWIYLYSNIIYYDNLVPGNYDLIIQASSSKEYKGPATTLHIHISPPWWQTWWAYTLYALTFIWLLWNYIQWRSRKLRERNIQLEEKVMHRTKELKHSLEDLRETQTQLIQREKMASLGELTAGIAHEIQNPLNFVNNFSEINVELLDELKEGPLKNLPEEDRIGASALVEGIAQNLEKTIHHGKRADAIVKGMLQHSRSSTGQKELTDINALTDEYFRLSFHGLRAKDKTFQSTIHSHFDQSIGKINIIPQDIGRVLLNLFNNAFYSVTEKKKQLGESFHPTVTVSTKKLDHKTEIRVHDNGMGIPQKIIDKIYQPFFTTKPTGEGTGLGLSLSYDIITKMHGGELKVETNEGEWTEFTVVIPG